MAPVMVWVNGMQRAVLTETLTYRQVVDLSGETYSKRWKVTYAGSPSSRPAGELVEGESVAVQRNTVFTVKAQNT